MDETSKIMLKGTVLYFHLIEFRASPFSAPYLPGLRKEMDGEDGAPMLAFTRV